MAMLPFIGYHIGDYLNHWLKLGEGADESKLPKIFYVNWFRRGANGKFLWPGYGENSRVIKWAIEQIEGAEGSIDSPIGKLPKPDALDIKGLDVNEADMAAVSKVNPAEWRAEISLIEDWFTKIVPKLPRQMSEQLSKLKAAL